MKRKAKKRYQFFTLGGSSIGGLIFYGLWIHILRLLSGINPWFGAASWNAVIFGSFDSKIFIYSLLVISVGALLGSFIDNKIKKAKIIFLIVSVVMLIFLYSEPLSNLDMGAKNDCEKSGGNYNLDQCVCSSGNFVQGNMCEPITQKDKTDCEGIGENAVDRDSNPVRGAVSCQIGYRFHEDSCLCVWARNGYTHSFGISQVRKGFTLVLYESGFNIK